MRAVPYRCGTLHMQLKQAQVDHGGQSHTVVVRFDVQLKHDQVDHGGQCYIAEKWQLKHAQVEHGGQCHSGAVC